MSSILVSGLINIETTLNIGKFPYEYTPVRYEFNKIGSTVSGVGYNVAKSLKTLGSEVNFNSLIGNDQNSNMVLDVLEKENINTKYILKKLNETPQSVILYDNKGIRSISVDLKDIQDTEYPQDAFIESLKKSDIAVLCNINFSRKYLKIAKEMNKIVVTDVHAISNLEDDYNKDFMKYADILFMSDEKIDNPEEFIEKTYKKFNNKIIVIGLGKKGALIHDSNKKEIKHFDSIEIRPIVNTIGAGDSLFSSFIHFYSKGIDSYESLRRAIIFAGYKIGEKSASEGFLTEKELEKYI